MNSAHMNLTNGSIPKNHKLQKLTQNETDNQDSSITIKEIESWFKTFQKRNLQVHMVSLMNSTQQLKIRINTNYIHNLFQKNRKVRKTFQIIV